MNAKQHALTDELHMKGTEFDKIMRRALQVHPETTPKAKKVSKPKSARKKGCVGK